MRKGSPASSTVPQRPQNLKPGGFWKPQPGQGPSPGAVDDEGGISRAALEAMAHQTHDLANAFAADGAPWCRLHIDGGMSVNDWMAQDLADILALEVDRPDFVETTALGAAILAAVGCGLFATLDDAAPAMRGAARCFSPQIDEAARAERLVRWRKALAAG